MLKCVVLEMSTQESVDDQSKDSHLALPLVRRAAKCAYGALDVLDFVSRLKQVYHKYHVITYSRMYVLSVIMNLSASDLYINTTESIASFC